MDPAPQSDEEASEIGTGLARKSSEFVLVQRHDAPFSPDVVFPRPEGTESKEILLIAFAADIIDNPSPLHAPVTYWPVPLEHRLAIWERRLYVGHGVGEGDIVGSLSDDPTLRSPKWNAMVGFTFMFRISITFLVTDL